MTSKSMLIVEDQPIVALDYKSNFERKGFSCITFFSGKKAIEYLKSEKPDLALLDIKLSDEVSGIEVGKSLNALSIPIIFISAFSDQENYNKALKLQPAHIFYKPININELNKVVERVISRNPEDNLEF